MKVGKTAINRLMLYGFLIMNLTGQAAGQQNPSDLPLKPPEHGFVSRLRATRWEESMLTGNGTIGALVPGYPLDERIIISHEKLFMPEYYPAKAPPLHTQMGTIKKLTLNGMGEEAAKLAVKLGKEVGIDDLIWTDPLIPACQLEIRSLSGGNVSHYTRSVNFENGEAIAAWQVGEISFERKVFISRADKIGVVKMSVSGGGRLDMKLRLNTLPIDPQEAQEEEWNTDGLIEMAAGGVKDDLLHYTTKFKKRWRGSLKGYYVEAKVILSGGSMTSDGQWLIVNGAEAILVLFDVQLSDVLPLNRFTRVERFSDKSYEKLLGRHELIHSEMFNRFSLNIGNTRQNGLTSEEIMASSAAGQLHPVLVNQLCEAARYILISSTGEIPPTLQGIWGGTWRPAWSGDFTLNGNVPSAIACGLNGNFREVTESYLNMMWSYFDDFRDNARELYKAPGIFVPSRCSNSGKTYHYLEPYPHLFWYAGGAWTAQFFYDYWQYTGNKKFLKGRAIPFMLAAMEFYEYILTQDNNGKRIFLPSYSPEIGPRGMHPVAINATMDVAALKQLIRNLLKLKDQGLLKTRKADTWAEILAALPEYGVDDDGDLKEWLWPGYKNNNRHRHASHLYPLFYEVDPDFLESPVLAEAAMTAIEKRLQYRREKKGAEMAFGLVQKGLAAAHIGDTRHAYECVQWLCHSYWSPAFTSYHDPGEIFNVDICGGLPAVVIDMIIQSSEENIFLLPALPVDWPEGSIKGALARGGFVVDLEWKDMKPVKVTVQSLLGNDARITLHEDVFELEMSKGECKTLTF